MRNILAIVLITALVLALPAFSADTGQRKGGTASGTRVEQLEKRREVDQERARSRTESEKQARLRDDEIYGHEFMSRQELKQYRRQLKTMKTAEARETFRLQHEERMRDRAMQQNRDLVPPGQGPVYRGDLMSVQERNEYREKLRNMQSDEERTRFLARHREEMNRRADAIEEETEEAE